jgi:hypothetical protein
MIPVTLTIYGIFDKKLPEVYIGKTNRTLKERFRGHHFFKKKNYPENKGKRAYNIKVIKQILLFPQNKFKEEDFEGYYIDKYRNEGYKILNKNDVPFKNPFDINNMIEEVKTPHTYKPIPVKYDVPYITNSVFWSEPMIVDPKVMIDKFGDHLNELHERGDRCKFLEMYLNYHYHSKNIDVPENWSFIFFTGSKYIDFNKCNHEGKLLETLPRM